MDVDGAVLSDTEHVFSKCVRTKDTWNGIRNLMVELLPSLDSKSDMQLLTLNFPRSQVDLELVWLIGCYMLEAWKFIARNDSTCMSRALLFGFLKYKYKEDQCGARPSFCRISQLI